MKSLTLRRVDEDVYKSLQDLARANHRSLQEQVKIILEREVRLAGGSHAYKARQLRERLAGRPWGDIAADIREERER